MSKNNKKIFIIGFCRSLTDSQIRNIFRSQGINNEIECITDEKLKKTATDKYCTKDYAEAIFVGPMPHKVKKSGDAKSFWDFLFLNQESYPPLIKLEEMSHSFKITKSSLLRAISKFMIMKKAS